MRLLNQKKVFEDVEGREPAIAVVHELHAALDDGSAFTNGDRVDDLQDVRMGPILCIKDRHDITGRML